MNHKERHSHRACISGSHRCQQGHGPWEAPTLAVPPDSSHSPRRFAVALHSKFTKFTKLGLGTKYEALKIAASQNGNYRHHANSIGNECSLKFPASRCGGHVSASRRLNLPSWTLRPVKGSLPKGRQDRGKGKGKGRARVRFRLARACTLQSNHHITRSAYWWK